MQVEPSKPSKRELTHDRIVEVASRAIRRKGYDGVGVADLMNEAGLTHGGFYAHFESRSAMLAEALVRAGQDSVAGVAAQIHARRAQGDSALRALIEIYLGDAHRCEVENGCPVAALGSEMSRQPTELQAASVGRVTALIAAVQTALPPDAAPTSAPLIASTLVGAVQLARALGTTDARAGQALLAVVRQQLLDQFEPG